MVRCNELGMGGNRVLQKSEKIVEHLKMKVMYMFYYTTISMQ